MIYCTREALNAMQKTMHYSVRTVDPTENNDGITDFGKPRKG